MIPRTHPLAGVREAYNAVFVEAESAGQLMFYGAGAGGAPTASAVLGDLVAVARNRVAGHARARRSPPTPTWPCTRWARPSRATTSRWTSPTSPACSPGSPTCSPSTTCPSRPSARRATATTRQLVIVTHRATDAALVRDLEGLRELDIVREVASVMRVEGEGAS